jgi:rod shape-determining protein MreD
MKKLSSTTLGITVILCLLLQLIVAPHIVIFGVTPLFIMIPVLLLGMDLGPLGGSLAGFAIGLLHDLGGSGPVGAMALSLAVAGYLAGILFDGDAQQPEEFTSVAIPLLVGVVLEEVIYGSLLLLVGLSTSVIAVFGYRVLPGILYTGIISFIGLAILYRFATSSERRMMNHSGHLH